MVLVKLRLFVAIELDDATRTFVAATVDGMVKQGLAGRFERTEKLHVTVAFLGAVEEERLAAVVQALRDASAQCRAFELRFERIGVFPNAQRPRVLWIGSEDDNMAFASCARHIRAAYERLGFTFDHEPVAHVTVCRPRALPGGILGPLATSATQTVRGVTLIRSLPAGPTTRYEALERTAFA